MTLKPPNRLDTDITLQNIMDLGGLFSNVELYELGQENKIKKKLVNKVINMKEKVKEHHGLKEEVKPDEFVTLLMGYLNTLAKNSTKAHARISNSIKSHTDLSVDYDVQGVQQMHAQTVIDIAKLITGNEE